jgi:hypothetical protein
MNYELSIFSNKQWKETYAAFNAPKREILSTRQAANQLISCSCFVPFPPTRQHGGYSVQNFVEGIVVVLKRIPRWEGQGAGLATRRMFIVNKII